MWLATPQAEAQMLPRPSEGELAATRMARDEVRALRFLQKRHTGLADRQLPGLAETIVAQAREHHLDLDLVLAVIFVESAGYNFAVSPVGARGLMQIMPATGAYLAGRLGYRWHGPDALFDPVLNLKLGTAYLRHLVNRYRGDVDAALAAYNWGPGHIDRRIASGESLPRLYPQLVRDALERRVNQSS
jgi:soluble lytic murein transglycosylase-like protein